MKNFIVQFKMIILFIRLFFLANSQIFCQTYNELEPVIFPDYQFFQPNPEVDSYPGILPNYYYNKYFEIPKSTLYLPSLKIDQLAVKSQFLIDTIYFHNNFQRNEKFKDYKRIFNYDQKLRIISIIAEELLNSKWQKHQETEIIYNDKNKISEIHYLRTNNPFEEFKIVYLFDSFGHLQEEICESKNNEKWSLNWKEKFSMKAGKLSYSDLYYYEDFDRLTFKYVGTDNQLIIESGYFSKDTSHIKYVYELDDRNKLLKFTSLELKDST